jgi:hypothetical protein
VHAFHSAGQAQKIVGIVETRRELVFDMEMAPRSMVLEMDMSEETRRILILTTA